MEIASMSRHDNGDRQPGIAASLVDLCHGHFTTSHCAGVVVFIVAAPVISAAGLFRGAEDGGRRQRASAGMSALRRQPTQPPSPALAVGDTEVLCPSL
jgi:hypothetical protein